MSSVIQRHAVTLTSHGDSEIAHVLIKQLYICSYNVLSSKRSIRAHCNSVSDQLWKPYSSCLAHAFLGIITQSGSQPVSYSVSSVTVFVLLAAYITVKINLGYFKPYFGHLSCIRFVGVTCKVQEVLAIWTLCSWEASLFVKLVSPFRKPINHAAFLVSFAVSLVLHICPWRVPWLHACGRNTRNVAK